MDLTFFDALQTLRQTELKWQRLIDEALTRVDSSEGKEATQNYPSQGLTATEVKE